jgi:diguanylate cyclase (GGDEF)-like protein
MKNRHFPRAGRVCVAVLLSLLALSISVGARAAAGAPAAGHTSAADTPAQLGDETAPRLRLYSDGQEYLLQQTWQFQPGDDPRWALPGYNDSHWLRKRMPERWPAGGYPATGQMAWYRLDLEIDLQDIPLGGQLPVLAVRTGQVMSAFELYAGGELIGAVGALPPAPEVQYDRIRIFPVPNEAIAEDGRLVLALRVWGGPQEMVDYWYGGPYYGAFRVGPYTELMQGMIASELPGFVAVVLFLAFGFYHLFLYYRNRHLSSYLWFGLLAVNIGVYSFSLGQWKYLLGWSFLEYEKLEYGSIHLMPAVAIQLVWVVLRQPVGRWLRLYQSSFVLFAVMIVLAPGLRSHYITLGWWHLWALPVMLYGPWVLLKATRRGNREARYLLPGVLVFCLSGIADILIHYTGLQSWPLIPIGFAAIALSMAASLADSFTHTLNTLEEEVARRTADLSEANLLLAEAARSDPLTDLLNRRGFREEAETEVQRFYRSGRPFSVVLGDVDHFKRINDSYGHACGDYVLRRIADLMKERLRDVDRAARWGGEELIMLLPETETQGAAVLADKLRRLIADSNFQFEGESVSVTMTFGVACFRKGETLDNCIARADTAMYHGKKAGRNKVMLGGYKGLTLVN